MGEKTIEYHIFLLHDLARYMQSILYAVSHMTSLLHGTPRPRPQRSSNVDKRTTEQPKSCIIVQKQTPLSYTGNKHDSVSSRDSKRRRAIYIALDVVQDTVTGNRFM